MLVKLTWGDSEFIGDIIGDNDDWSEDKDFGIVVMHKFMH
jgi:hypothetical protein